MKIVVNISEDKYKALQKCSEAGMELSVVEKAVVNGIVIPDDWGNKPKDNTRPVYANEWL